MSKQTSGRPTSSRQKSGQQTAGQQTSGLQTSRTKPAVIGLLLGLFVAALDQTIVATAMPTVVKELGGFELFVWVFSAYMIASVVATPIFGKLSDIYGRKRFFLFGLVVFLIGSILCGLSTTMMQ